MLAGTSPWKGQGANCNWDTGWLSELCEAQGACWSCGGTARQTRQKPETQAERLSCPTALSSAGNAPFDLVARRPRHLDTHPSPIWTATAPGPSRHVAVPVGPPVAAGCALGAGTRYAGCYAPQPASVRLGNGCLGVRSPGAPPRWNGPRTARSGVCQNMATARVGNAGLSARDARQRLPR